MSEQVAHNVGPARIAIAYERFGDRAAPPVLLTKGGGAQMTNWPRRGSVPSWSTAACT
jgi:hypothetical protein